MIRTINEFKRHRQNVSLLNETLILPSTEPGTMSFWHGGNLDDYDQTISHKGGRWEYGPGLYLTTQYDTAKKYAKGSRKFYMVTVSKGQDLNDTMLPLDAVKLFLDAHCIRSARKEVNAAIERRQKEGSLNGNTFLTILINNKALKNTDTYTLREFFVNNGADYLIVDNAFGWHERMLVLFNMDKIVSTVQVKPGDKIETFDLPNKFVNESKMNMTLECKKMITWWGNTGYLYYKSMKPGDPALSEQADKMLTVIYDAVVKGEWNDYVNGRKHAEYDKNDQSQWYKNPVWSDENVYKHISKDCIDRIFSENLSTVDEPMMVAKNYDKDKKNLLNDGWYSFSTKMNAYMGMFGDHYIEYELPKGFKYLDTHDLADGNEVLIWGPDLKDAKFVTDVFTWHKKDI